MKNATIKNQTAPATQTIWVLSYALPEGNTVRPTSSPDIFTTEAEAVAAFDKAMREEWPSNAPCDAEGESLPYPGDPWKAHEAIVDDKAKGDVDEPWGEWNLSSHKIPLPAQMPAAPSPDAMALLKDLLASYEENSSRWARGDSYETEDRACISEMILRGRALLAGKASQSPVTMAATIIETEHGEPIEGGTIQAIDIEISPEALHVTLGELSNPESPSIMAELQNEGWVIYINENSNDGPCNKIVLPVAKA